jgi:hypothetical protein
MRDILQPYRVVKQNLEPRVLNEVSFNNFLNNEISVALSHLVKQRHLGDTSVVT